MGPLLTFSERFFIFFETLEFVGVVDLHVAVV